MDVDVDDLFAQAELAKAEEVANEDDVDQLEETSRIFSNGGELRTRPARRGRPMVFPIGNGDYHVCFGADCPEAVLDKERQLVCGITGIVICKECAQSEDASWTGRSTSSADPDDSAGMPQHGWFKRRDMFAASAQAWADAVGRPTQREWAQPQTEPAAEPTGGRGSSKRGALCVDQVDEVRVTVVKRQRVQDPRRIRKLDGATRAHDKFKKEAMGIIGTLMSDGHPVSKGSTFNTPAEAMPPPPPDPRLQNVEFVRQLALKKYIKKCADGEALLSMDGVHDVCVWANEFVREQRSRGASTASASTASNASTAPPRSSAARSGQVRSVLANLIVTLWSASSKTPHMTTGRKGGDSFRPFAAGVLYQLKRGLFMNNGSCIIPCLPELSDTLPALRCPQASPAARQLQSSSHRGICSLHKSLSSVADLAGPELDRVNSSFASAANVAAMLQQVVEKSA